MRIDLPGIEAFLSIANWGSFRRAAGHLNLSQAALSHRLKKLEDELGVALLTRTTRQVSLTPAGLELLPVAQRMVHDISATLDGLRERSRDQQERFAIGCLPTIASLHLSPILSAFHAQFPSTTVQIFDNSTIEIADRVRARQAAFGVTIVSSNSWDLEITPLCKDPFVVVCQKDHAFAGRAQVEWREMEGQPLIRISAEAGNRELIDAALGSRRELMRWRCEVQRVSTAIDFVLGGLGLTIVPRAGFDVFGRAGLTAVPLRSPHIARPLGIVARRDDPLPAGPALLMKLICETLRASASKSEE